MEDYLKLLSTDESYSFSSLPSQPLFSFRFLLEHGPNLPSKTAQISEKATLWEGETSTVKVLSLKVGQSFYTLFGVRMAKEESPDQDYPVAVMNRERFWWLNDMLGLPDEQIELFESVDQRVEVGKDFAVVSGLPMVSSVEIVLVGFD